MESGKRFGFSVAEKSKIWSRWKSGQSPHEIGRSFDKPTQLDSVFVVGLRYARIMYWYRYVGDDISLTSMFLVSSAVTSLPY